MASFGKELRKEFLLEKDHVFINHGSYGSVAAKVHQERLRLLTLSEENPDNWFRRLVHQVQPRNLQAAATFLHAQPTDIVFVPNATSAANCVVKSYPFQAGDAILVYSYTYNAVKNACVSAMERCGGEVITLNLDLKVPSVDFVVKKYREYLEKYPSIKLVLLDYISSSTAIKFPVKELIDLCKQHGKLVLVDGAHTPGQIPVNLQQMKEWGMDFYTGNLHKWMYVPRGCCVLWVHPQHQSVIRPVVTSHNFKADTFQMDFATQGTNDETPYYCVEKAIEVYQNLGGLSEIPPYSSSLLDQASDMLSAAWNTEKFPIPREMESPFMRLVRLPDLKKFPLQDTQSIFSDIHSLMAVLYERFHITAVTLGIYGKQWVRMAANVYNQMSDYEALRDAILTLKQEETSTN